MKGLCRDCDVTPKDGDDTCIDRPLLCKFLTKNDVVGKSKDELNDYSFLPIKNCFHGISFGGCERNVYGATPAEILHAVLLGLCEYIADAMELIFTDGSFDLISQTVVGIYNESRRQSERDLPDLGPFRQGIMSIANLKAKERFARVYCVFLALCNTNLVEQLLVRRRKKNYNDDNDPPFFTIEYLQKLLSVLEETVLFHLWLKKDSYLKSDLERNNGEVDSIAEKRIKLYLENYKSIIVRRGNNLKTPKFHQMLHVVDYIKGMDVP